MKYRIIEVPKPEPVGEMYEVQIKLDYFTGWRKITGDSYFLIEDAKQALVKYKNKDKTIKVVYSE